MNKEEMERILEELEKHDILNAYEDILLLNYIKQLQQENKKIKENWDKLKECIKFNRKTSLSLDNGFSVSLCDTLLNKMEELEDK